MTHLSRMPKGSQGRSQAEVLREIVEQQGEDGPLREAAQSALLNEWEIEECDGVTSKAR